MSEDQKLSPLSPSLLASASVSPSPAALDTPSIEALTRALRGNEKALLQVHATAHTILKLQAEHQKSVSTMRLEVATVAETQRLLSVSVQEMTRATIDNRHSGQRTTEAIVKLREETATHRIQAVAPEAVYMATRRLTDLAWPYVVRVFTSYGVFGASMAWLWHSISTWVLR